MLILTFLVFVWLYEYNRYIHLIYMLAALSFHIPVHICFLILCIVKCLKLKNLYYTILYIFFSFERICTLGTRYSLSEFLQTCIKIYFNRFNKKKRNLKFHSIAKITKWAYLLSLSLLALNSKYSAQVQVGLDATG